MTKINAIEWTAEQREFLGLPPTEMTLEKDPVDLMKEGRKALQWLSEMKVIGASQTSTVRSAMRGEEGEFFAEKMIEIRGIVEGMPALYQTDGMGADAPVSLHYFRGNMDWFITENEDLRVRLLGRCYDGGTGIHRIQGTDRQRGGTRFLLERKATGRSQGRNRSMSDDINQIGAAFHDLHSSDQKEKAHQQKLYDQRRITALDVQPDEPLTVREVKRCLRSPLIKEARVWVRLFFGCDDLPVTIPKTSLLNALKEVDLFTDREYQDDTTEFKLVNEGGNLLVVPTTD